MPIGVDFNAVDAMPRPAGLVGLHRSRRQGSGSEPAEVRPFRPGDRLRRINWAVSSRVGTLHVTSTWADRDAHVMLLLDSEHDIGVSEGIDGAASSLDIAMRAAAAVGEHYLRTGDRVSLVDLGRRVRDVPAGSGRRHLRRLLEVLVAAQPGPNHRAEAVRIRPVAAGALVVALTPLVGRLGRDQVAHLAQHGHAVVVVDTLPDAVADVGELVVAGRWPAGCAPSSGRPRSTASASSASPSCAGAAAGRSTRCCTRSAGWPRRRGCDEARRHADRRHRDRPAHRGRAAAAARCSSRSASSSPSLGTALPAWDVPNAYVVLAVIFAVVWTFAPDTHAGLVFLGASWAWPG